MKNTQLSSLDRLNEIIESIDLISEWSAGINQAVEFLITSNNVMVFNACVMRLQVIGERVGRLMKDSPELLETHSEIPWLAIYDMRNIISHEYSNVDGDVVFSTIKDDLPPLRIVIEQMLNEA